MSVELDELKKLVERLAMDVEELKRARKEERKAVIKEVAKVIPEDFVESILRVLEAKLGDKPEGGLILISGIERKGGRTVDSFLSAIDLEDAIKCLPSKIARLMGSFSSENRVRIMQSLLKGIKTSSELSKETGLEGGQLYHHLKELMMAGYVQAVERGKYALTSNGCIVIRTIACLASIPGMTALAPEEMELEQ